MQWSRCSPREPESLRHTGEKPGIGPITAATLVVELATRIGHARVNVREVAPRAAIRDIDGARQYTAPKVSENQTRSEAPAPPGDITPIKLFVECGTTNHDDTTSPFASPLDKGARPTAPH